MKYSQQVLAKEYERLAGELFGDFVLREQGSDEVKKTLEANDFMMGLLKGEIKKEWKLEETEEFKNLVELATAINKLSNE